MNSVRYFSRAALPRVAYRSSHRFAHRQLRHQSTTSTSTSSSGGGSGTHFATSVGGGIVGAGLAYAIYSFTPAGQTASKLNKAAAEANKQYQAAAKKLQQASPDADQAVDSIKQFAYSYAGWVPGGRGYVDAAFKDWDTVRENHREEADKAVNEAYGKFKDLSKSGLSLDTASKAYEILADLGRKIADLSGDALSDILDNHPEIKSKFGGTVEQLKNMGDQYGPEAKKQVDETWRQLRDVIGGGLNGGNIDKARQLVQDKLNELRKMGDQAWSKGLEEAKPYLDKAPQVKELVEKNADSLRQGNAKELFDKVRAAADSGNMDDLKKYVNDTVSSAKQKGQEAAQDWGLEGWLGQLWQGAEVPAKLQVLARAAEKHKDEGEKLLKETIDEVKQLLDKKSKRAKELVESAEKEAKKDS